jgi:hypothetical protein
MKQQIFVDDVHEYDYDVVDDNIHALYFQGGQWNSHLLGTVAMAIEDDGNGLQVFFEELGRIDYAEAERLFILLKLINQPAKYEIGTKRTL